MIRRVAAGWRFAICAVFAAQLAPVSAAAADAPAAPSARIEARSANYLIVGVLRGESMAIHLNRLLDNAPVHDAVLEVTFRGAAHATVAQVDGSYLLEANELALPGPVVMEFQVSAAGNAEKLSGTLDIGGKLDVGGGHQGTDDRGSLRSMAWWVLNFAVCIGFLLLWSGRRKRAAAAEAAAEAAEAREDQ